MLSCSVFICCFFFRIEAGTFLSCGYFIPLMPDDFPSHFLFRPLHWSILLHFALAVSYLLSNLFTILAFEPKSSLYIHVAIFAHRSHIASNLLFNAWYFVLFAYLPHRDGLIAWLLYMHWDSQISDLQRLYALHCVSFGCQKGASYFRPLVLFPCFLISPLFLLLAV